MSRATAIGVAGVVGALALASLLLPWWQQTSAVEGSRQGGTHFYGPFHRGATPGDSFRTEVTALGIAVVALIAVSAIAAGLLVKGRAGAGRALLALAALLGLGAAAYVFVAFPAAAAGSPSFFDRTCAPEGIYTICHTTRPGLGWYVGALAGALALVGIGATTRPRAAKRPTPTAVAPTSPVTSEPAPAGRHMRVVHARGVAPGTTQRTKCSRCQTWISHTRGAAAVCHNCGHRWSGS